MGQSRPLFLYFLPFNTVASKHSILIFADDWIRTAESEVTALPTDHTTAHYLMDFTNFI